MLRSRKLDDKEIQLRNQNRIFFQISGAGHEAMLVAAGLTLKPGYDWFHPYYRDRALALQLGMTSLDILLAGVGAESDPSNGGRQMPSHWGSPALHIVAGSSATATQVLHAVGMAEAGVIYDRVTGIPDREPRFQSDEVVYVSLGEGATSEGEFWEALNTSCTKQLPVLFLVEDNGYAISVPVEVQTPGGDISRLLRSFPVASRRRRSTAPTSSPACARCARPSAYVRARKGPALVHAHVIRPYSHSLLGRRAAVQDAGGARSRGAPRSDCRDSRSSFVTQSLATAPISPRLARARSRDRRGGDAGARRRRSRSKSDARGSLLARRRSRPPRRSTRGRRPTARPTRWWKPSTAR